MTKYLLFALCALPCAAQIQGTVVDAATQAPIEGARVRIHKSLTFTETDVNGFFSLDDATATALAGDSAALRRYLTDLAVATGDRLVAVADLWIADEAASSPGTAIHWDDGPELH